MSIPADAIVQVNPGLLVPGGTDLELNGLFAYDTPQIPPGGVVAFASLNDAKAYFLPDTEILKPIGIYFRGYNNSPIKPRLLYVARWVSKARSPYVVGAEHDTLDELKAITNGTLTLMMGEWEDTLTGLDFSAATSFSAVAAIVQTAMLASGNNSAVWNQSICTYDGVFSRFIIGSGYNPQSKDQLIFPPTGDAATAMGLDVGTAYDGLRAQPPGECMDAIKKVTTNWVTFTSGKADSIPTEDEQLAFAQWSNDQGVRYLYALYEDNPNLIEQLTTTIGQQIESSGSTDDIGYQIQDLDLPGAEENPQPAELSSTDNIGQKIQDLGLSGVAGEYGEIEYAAFLMGVAASIDYNRPDGAITTAFKAQDGIPFNVTDEAVANKLTENGFNYYGNWATANDQFKFHYPGQMFGRYLWVDTYLNAIWLNNALQVSLMSGLSSVGRSPHNARGYAMVRAWMLDPIQRALSAGVIDTGIVLDESQKAEIAAQAGMDISAQLQTSGYFIQILDPGPVPRKERKSPIINFWYTYGGSIQQLVLASRAIV
ncbi:MAG TPA: DUF3383 domain-containing protein [Pseudomonas sp.]|uniref:DUF3383 domain-containing protein n=1 Tax=Pseudomonas sp. TaxID=306 RepID=UPI002C6EA909|nr:DUF3383 domain-containing protein [Pseudomonas sp.]HWH86162.1 DUF3383 domain-containing protein [Pseudomonas sp.]